MRNILKNFTKLFSLLLIVLLAVALIGCGGDNGGNNNGGNNNGGNGNTQDPNQDPNQGKQHEWTENELFWDSDKNGTPDWQEKEITLRYATWQYNNPEAVTIDTLLIEKFMEKYPNIHVEMQIVGESTEWETAFLALMENPEDLPDVFLINRLENILSYNILADITDFFNHDEDTDYIFDSVKDLGLYKGRRYCVPTFIYPEIWLVNLDLLEECNIAAPSYDWTWDQMEAIAKAVYQARGTVHSIGIYGSDQYYFELPKVLKQASDPEAASKWLAYGYDGEKFNFSDDAYIRAMSKLEEGLTDGWLVNQLDEETLLEYYGNTIDPRYSGQVAIWRQPSWEFKDYAADLQFQWDVYAFLCLKFV